MNRSFLKGAAVGLVCAVLGGAAVAFAGSGVNGVFNLGVSNSVDAKTTLTGASSGAQLQVTNTNSVGGAYGLGVTSASGSATASFTNSSTGTGLSVVSTSGTGISAQTGGAAKPALSGKNTAGGPAGAFTVNAGVSPFTVSSTAKVANLNSDQLDGLDSNQLQRRVTGTCAAGTAVQVVNSDGSVNCQAVGTGGGWSLTGNAGTTPGTNFLGTTDSQPLVVKTGGNEAMRVTAGGDVGIGTTSPVVKLEADSSTFDPALLANNTGNGPAADFQVANLSSAPFAVNSATKVSFLNADYLDGFHASAFQETVGGTCSNGSAIGSIASDGSVTCNHESLRPGFTNVGIGVNLAAGQCGELEVVVSGIAVGDTAIIVPDAATWPTGLIYDVLRADQSGHIPMGVCNLSGSNVNVNSTVSIWKVLLTP
jgi:hypothetical protein